MTDKGGKHPTRDEDTIERKRGGWGGYDDRKDEAHVPRDEYKQPLEPWPEKPKKK